MIEPARFGYQAVIDPTGARLLRPVVSISLTHARQSIVADALIDSGADANVLPYQSGLDLGARS